MNAKHQLSQRLKSLIDTLAPADQEIYEFCNALCANWENDSGYLLDIRDTMHCYQALLKTLKMINSKENIQNVLAMMMDTAIELTGAERGFLLLNDLQIARHFDGEDIVGKYKISNSIAETVKDSGVPFLTSNAQQDQRLDRYDSVRKYRALSVLCIPISLHDKTQGVIYLDNRLLRGRFRDNHVQLLVAFAEQTALAMENARLYQETLDRSSKIHALNIKLRRQVRQVTQNIQLISPQNIQDQHYYQIYGQSAKMRELFATLEKIKDCEMPILIQGESGTGKELVARAIHSAGKYNKANFISENCAAIPDTLFESELFGYEKNAFTGAQQMKKGLFEQAQSGTLFLDEIGEVSIDIQKKLLRVLAEKKVRRIGGNREIAIQVRIITATNRNLKGMVHSKQFREDLFYRLNGISICLPPLRDRREDIPLLVDHFLQQIATNNCEETKKIDRSLLAVLIDYDWPGNVRQLRNELFRLVALSESTLDARYLSPEILPEQAVSPTDKVNNLAQLLHKVEKNEIVKALIHAKNNKSRAAQLLGISRFTLQRKIDKHGLR